MPRLHQVSRAEASAPIVTTMYDLLFEDRDPVAEPGTATGTRGDWWPAFANVPDILEHAVQGFGIYQSPRRVLDPVLRELGQARAGWAAGSQFVFSQHCKAARYAGVPDEKLRDLPAWSVSDVFDDVDRAILAYTDQLVLEGGRVQDDVFAQLQRHLSDEAILELTYLVATYAMHATICRALRLEYDDVPERVTEVAAPGDASADVMGQISR